MRNAIVIGLAIVAVLAAGVWGLGQFGGAPTGGVGEPQAPIVREPEIVVASAPVQPPAANPQASLRSAPAATPAPAAPKADAPAAPAAEPVAPQAVEPETQAAAEPQADQPEVNGKPALTTTLDGKNGLQLPKLGAPKQQAPAQAEAPAAVQEPAEPAPQARTAPPAEAQASTQAAEPRVFAQQAPTVVEAVPAGLEAQFKSRKVTYNRPPQKLALDKAIDVSLVINATADENAGQEALQGFPGTIVERDVELSDTVSAQLTGVGFDITSQTVERQRLSGKVLNRWAWRVTPTEIGEHTLILEIFGYASGSLDAEPLDAYRDVIVVEVQQFDQIVSWAKGVQPLFAVLAALAGIGSAVFAFLRFREEKKQNRKASE